MTQHDIHSSLAIFNYSNQKLCDLYDSQNDLAGQAFGIERTINLQDGVKNLSFSIPYMVDSKKNFRWKYLKSEYLIRLIYKGKTEWYIAQKPSKHKDKSGIYGEVVCSGSESALKTMNIYKEFDDENGIGTLSELVDKILSGTGWHRGYTDPMLEQDGVTEKIRSLKSNNKQGALGLMTTVCNLFKCYPVYDSDKKTVELYNFNNREQVLEGVVGVNMEALNVTHNSTDIITRLYVEGEYGEDGYIGIDSVNPTHLNYIFNFDYFREIGLFTAEHEAALQQYLEDIALAKSAISTNTERILAKEDEINALVGQCKFSIYYRESGFLTPVYTYGDPTTEQKALNVGDDVVVLKNGRTHRYVTIETTPEALLEFDDYGIVKFAKKASGSIGAMEVQIEAKEKEIANLQRKIASTTKQEKIDEYNLEIGRLQSEIHMIYIQYDGTGLYDKMDALVNPYGLIYQLHRYELIADSLNINQDQIESDFIVAMGDMLRDGYWNNNNYIQGQEQHLFDDATDRMNELSKPTVDYSFNLIRLHKDFGIPLEDFKLNAIFRIHDDELDVNENLFITKITIGIDNEDDGSVEVSNRDITINSNDLGSLLSRMSQLSDLIEQKNTLYERAKAISQNGTLYVDRLNGQIDVLKNQLLSTVSNWHTDEQGNILFESADGGSAMMLCGAGFMIANSKDDNDEWIWRTFGTGEGFTADEIVAGFISADRIEAGTISTDKVEPGFGGSLVLTGNPSITALNEAIAPEFVENNAYTAGQHISHNGIFYVFNTDFPGGTFAEALPYLSNTNVATEIELLPDKIVQYVGSKGYGKTFVQLTDPCLDPENNVAVGDYWIVSGNTMTWGKVKESTWNDTKKKIYDALASGQTVYYWNGVKWVRIYDTAVITEAYTRITQTQDMILQEAERSEGTYIKKTEQLQTADAIVAKAEEYVDDELVNYSTHEQTASAILTTISTALGNYYTKTETASQIEETLSTALGDYYTKTETASQIAATLSTALGDYYTKTETASEISSTLSTALGDYYTKTETASEITATISSKLGNYYTKTQTDSKISSTISTALGDYSTTSQTAASISAAVSNRYGVVSGININASGIEVSGSKYIKLTSSNGVFDVNTTNFKLSSSGQYMTTGGWTLNSNGLNYKNGNEYMVLGRDGDVFVFGFKNTNTQFPVGDSAYNAFFGWNYPKYQGIGMECCLYFSKSGKCGLIGSEYLPVREIWSDYVIYWNLVNMSSRKYKHDIVNIQDMGKKIDQLNPVYFRYNNDPDKVHMGLIYEDTVDVMPEICVSGTDVLSINYIELVPVLLKEIQSLRKRVAALEQA